MKKNLELLVCIIKKAKFSCYTDSIFTYTLKHQKTFFEISFISDDTLIDKLTCKELLELNKICFYRVRIFNENKECISNISVANVNEV